MQGSWTFAIGGAVIAALLTLKVHMSRDDATALGILPAVRHQRKPLTA